MNPSHIKVVTGLAIASVFSASYLSAQVDVSGVGVVTGGAGPLTVDGSAVVNSNLTTSTLTVNNATNTNGVSNTGNLFTDTLSVLNGSITGGIDNLGLIETDSLLVTGPATVTGTLAAGAIVDVEAAINGNTAAIDAVEVGAGLAANGDYIQNVGANYIATATSLADADNQLDAALLTEETARIDADTLLQTNQDAIEAGAGLAANGAYIQNGGANYIASATSLADADDLLDAQVFNNQQQIANQGNAIAGLQSSVTRNKRDIDENRRGIAMVAALQHTTVLPGMTNALDVGAAHFDGETGMSINYARRINENWQVNFGAASTTNLEESVVKAGIGVQW